MAKTYPDSEFVGYDYHDDSIRVATEKAAAAGATNARFEVADAVGYAGKDFDLIAFFDCLHDMGDPVGVSRHAREAISDDGTAMIVEPFANDRRAGQPQSGGPRDVRRVHPDLRAGIPGAQRTRTRRSGR